MSGLWNGFEERPSGFISRMEGIFPVKKGKDYLKEDNEYIYAYLPKQYHNLLKTSSEQTLLFAPSLDELEYPYINYEDIKDAFIPERKRGTEDKWLSETEITNELL